MRRIVMAGAAAAALLATGPATGTPVAGAAPVHESTGAACRDTPTGTGSTNARLRPGATAADPNTVSASQARSIDRTLLARLRNLSPAERTAARRADAPVVINVYWHVITKANGSGNVEPRIGKQLKVLNDAYEGATSGAAANTRFCSAPPTSAPEQRLVRLGGPRGGPG